MYLLNVNNVLILLLKSKTILLCFYQNIIQANYCASLKDLKLKFKLSIDSSSIKLKRFIII